MILNNRSDSKKQTLSLFFGGLLPIIAFTLVEETYGAMAGLFVAMIFGIIEIIYELVRYKKVTNMTWIGNGLVIGLGCVSLISNEGYWFKLQPALLEFGMFVFLGVSWLIKKPFLQMIIEKQNPETPKFIQIHLNNMTLRLSFFMLAHSIIAVWAALYWSTQNWALLKGLGLTISMIIYVIIEVIWMRTKLKKGID